MEIQTVQFEACFQRSFFKFFSCLCVLMFDRNCLFKICFITVYDLSVSEASVCCNQVRTTQWFVISQTHGSTRCGSIRLFAGFPSTSNLHNIHKPKGLFWSVRLSVLTCMHLRFIFHVQEIFMPFKEPWESVWSILGYLTSQRTLRGFEIAISSDFQIWCQATQEFTLSIPALTTQTPQSTEAISTQNPWTSPTKLPCKCDESMNVFQNDVERMHWNLAVRCFWRGHLQQLNLQLRLLKQLKRQSNFVKKYSNGFFWVWVFCLHRIIEFSNFALGTWQSIIYIEVLDKSANSENNCPCIIHYAILSFHHNRKNLGDQNHWRTHHNNYYNTRTTCNIATMA